MYGDDMERPNDPRPLPTKDRRTCEHENFHANCAVYRLVDEKRRERVNAFVAELTICCVDCGTPMEFIGFTAGYRGDAPRVDPSAQELRLPLKPKGVLAMPGIPGFDIKVN